MKKKILLTILVILLVGVLTASVIACTGNSGGTNKPGKTDKTDKKDDKGDVEEANLELTEDLTNIVKELDKTIQTVSEIKDEGSVNATIYLDLNTGAEDATPLNLAINIAGSMSGKTKAYNWAEITVKNGEKDLFGLAIRSNQDGQEYLYIGQPIVSGEYQWVKLSQFEDASIFYGKAISALQNLLAKAGVTTNEKGEEVENAIWTKIENGNLINGYVGGFLPMAGSALSGLFKVNAGATTTKVDDAYILDLDVASLGSMMSSLSSLLSSLELPQEYLSLVNIGVKLLLGSEVTFAELEKTPGKYVISGINTVKGESIPSIKISVGSKDGKTTGVGLAYEKDSFKLALGIKDLALNASAASASDIKADELAIKLSANLDGINGMVDGGANLDVVIQPNVKVGFWGEEDEGVTFEVEGKEYSREGYVKINFDGLYGYANLNGTTIADYNLSSENGFAIDISKVVDVLGLSEDIAIENKYIVPFDAQSMFNSWIDSLVTAPKEEEKVEEPANAASTNIVDNVWGIVESFINDGFQISAVGDILALVTGEGEDSLLAIAKGIIEEVVVKNNKNEVIGIELDLGELMVADGKIGSIINGSEKLAGLKVADAYNAEGEKNVEVYLLDLLKADKLFDYVLGFINAAVYEANAPYNIDKDGNHVYTESIVDFEKRASGYTIAENGYVWTTLQDVKDLAKNIFGISEDGIEDLRKNIYDGTTISLDLSNAGAVELSISLAGKSASIGGGVAFVDNVAIANHKATQKINVEDAIDLTKDNNWMGIANIGLDILNHYLGNKYSVNHVSFFPKELYGTWYLSDDGTEIVIKEESITQDGYECSDYSISVLENVTYYCFSCNRWPYAIYQEEGVWCLAELTRVGYVYLDKLLAEAPAEKVLAIGTQTVSANYNGIEYTLTAKESGSYTISSEDDNAWIIVADDEAGISEGGTEITVTLSKGDCISILCCTNYGDDEYEVVVAFTAQA